MDNTKYITLEQDILKLENSIKQIKISMVDGFFDGEYIPYKSYRTEYYKGFGYDEQKATRRRVNRTVKNCVRLCNVMYKKLDFSDLNTSIQAMKLSNELARLQLRLIF